MKTILSLIAGASILAVASGASAQGPVQLSDRQMDQVTAGISFSWQGDALSTATGLGYANLLTQSVTQTIAGADPAGLGGACGGIPCSFARAGAATNSISVYTPGLGLLTDANGDPIANAAAVNSSRAASALY